MVTAVSLLDHNFAIEATLPSLSLRSLEELLRAWIFWTLATLVPLLVAGATGFGLASRACSILLACVGPATPVTFDVRRWDPLPTSLRWTIHAIFCSVLLKFLIPMLLELGIKQLLNVFQGYAVSSTAFGRHIGRIFYRKFENCAKASVAIVMRASKFGALGYRGLIVHTNDAFNSILGKLTGLGHGGECSCTHFFTGRGGSAGLADPNTDPLTPDERSPFLAIDRVVDAAMEGVFSTCATFSPFSIFSAFSTCPTFPTLSVLLTMRTFSALSPMWEMVDDTTDRGPAFRADVRLRSKDLGNIDKGGGSRSETLLMYTIS